VDPIVKVIIVFLIVIAIIFIALYYIMNMTANTQGLTTNS